MKNKFYLVVSFIISSFVLTLPAYAAIGVATIKGTTEGSPIAGTVTIVEKDGGIEVEANVVNVPNPGKHGFHIHEVGSCAEGGKAAGGHFNPSKVDHGFLSKDGHAHAHAGDMGNIEILADGTGSLKEFLPGVFVTGTQPSVDGLSIVLHEKEDDFGQPTGNAGGRIGCGIIEISKEDQQISETLKEPVINVQKINIDEVPSPMEQK